MEGVTEQIVKVLKCLRPVQPPVYLHLNSCDPKSGREAQKTQNRMAHSNSIILFNIKQSTKRLTNISTLLIIMHYVVNVH